MQVGKSFIKLLFIFLFSITGVVQAQYKKGLALYNHNDYFKAIPKLRKASSKKGENQTDALIKLADSYRYIKDYKNSEVFYKKAIESSVKIDPIVHYYYGLMLKTNNHYDAAQKEFYIYLEENPSDGRVAAAIKSCNEIKIWQNKPKEYDVTNLEAVNSEKAEFSPVLFENKLVFVSERNQDLVNYQEYDYNGQPFLNVYFTSLINEIPGKKVKGFSKKVNTNYHDGPVCFSKDFKTMYLTRVNYIVNKKDNNFINRAKIFISHSGGHDWHKPTPFQYNSDEFSVAHPSISDDGNWLFFTSDMPGGLGGKDIYVCKKNGEGWEKPKNLGPDINTTGDEVFPVIRADGTLFYSSDGLPGFGGLDIYSAREIVGKWILQRNEGLGMNSFTDDFAPCFATDKKGYFSSDRDGGKGHDDIYSFTFTSRYISLDGTVLSDMDLEKPVPGIAVILEDEKGNVLNSTTTNSKGYFKFDNLETDKKYMVKVDEKDPGFKGQNRFYYADAKNNIVRVTVVNDKGEKFVFRNLPSDPNSPPELTNPDDITIAGNLLFGENPSGPIANSRLVLKDASGHIIDEVTTNALGGFVFSKLSPDGNYVLEIMETDLPLANAKIILTNKSGKEVKVLKADGSGKFNFHVLATEKTILKDMKVEEKDLLMNIRGKLLDSDKKILSGKDVHLMDDKGNTLETVKTDATGKFEFKNLAADKKYIIGVDEKDTQLTNYEKLFITDLKGKVIRELFRDKLKGFKFHLLETDKNHMAELYVDDPWLKVLEFKNNSVKQELTIVEKVSYGLNEYKIDQNGQRVLDKVIQIMKDNPSIKIELSSHTDSRAADDFNKKLSEKRANFAVNYMISKGVDKTKIIPLGLGETKLLNACGNTSVCTEEEHAINRRTEFKVIDNK